VFLYVKELFEKRIDFIPSILNDKITNESPLETVLFDQNESVSELDDSLESNLNDSSSVTTTFTIETMPTTNEMSTTNETAPAYEMSTPNDTATTNEMSTPN
jgi:hypothetical protein